MDKARHGENYLKMKEKYKKLKRKHKNLKKVSQFVMGCVQQKGML